jgi:hypothetical protein
MVFRLDEVRRTETIKALARKLRAFIGNDSHGFYVAGSGRVWVPNARAHQIPKVVAEDHRENAERELLRALMGGRR